MTYKVKKGTSLKDFNKLLQSIASKPAKHGFQAKKYCGVLSTDIDPMDYQNQVRNEW